MKTFFFSLLAGLLSFPAQAIKPDRKYIRLPQHLGLIYRPLDVQTSDGYRITTWFFPAQDFPQKNAGKEEPLPYKTIDKKKRPTIIICNGDAGNMSYYQLALAMYYTARGYNIATFDWRGFGTSDEFPMENHYLCYTEMLSDYAAVISSAAAQPETDSQGIYLLGWSTGAYLSMIAANAHSQVKGCILRGVPTSFEEVIPLLKKDTGKTDADLLIPDDFPTGSMPLALAPLFRKDILIVVGDKDARTPAWMAEKIFAALPENIMKKCWIVPGAEHGGTKAPEFLYPEEFLEKTILFLQESYAKK